MPGGLSVAIRGAGLAGMSLAMQLVRSSDEVSISIFDRRARLPHPQRTFCFFNLRDEFNISEIPHHSWNYILFRSSSFERRIDVSTSPYTMIRGDDFFDRALRTLEDQGVSFHWGCNRVDIEGNGIVVDTERFIFDRVVDAAFDPTTASSMMWQSFAGFSVETDQPCFDPTTATLMDLLPSSDDAAVSFLYVLPTSAHSALVEHTTFSRAPLSVERHFEHCNLWFGKNVAGDFRIVGRECGAIPMGIKIENQGPSIVVGTNGGAVRAATGYAFRATLIQARRICEAILHGGSTSSVPYAKWLTLGDRLFLRALVNSPKSGEALLAGLISNAPVDALIPFLSGEATLTQALSVWFSVPKVAMIRSLLCPIV